MFFIKLILLYCHYCWLVAISFHIFVVAPQDRKPLVPLTDVPADLKAKVDEAMKGAQEEEVEAEIRKARWSRSLISIKSC